MEVEPDEMLMTGCGWLDGTLTDMIMAQIELMENGSSYVGRNMNIIMVQVSSWRLAHHMQVGTWI